MKVEVERLQGERGRVQEERFKLRGKDAVFLRILDLVPDRPAVPTLSMLRIPLQRAWPDHAILGAFLTISGGTLKRATRVRRS